MSEPKATTPGPGMPEQGTNLAITTTNKTTGVQSEYSTISNYPSGLKLAIILASLYISVFLIALDRTIIGVAVPKITDEFHSINDIGWYGAAYMLTACGFILTYGKVYYFMKTKWVFLSGIILFELGSALCGAAPNSTSFIIGRAIAGFGSSGMFTGAIQILVTCIPLHKRPLYQGLFGAAFGLASVAGPLIGGAFTQGRAGWRWCFYINLPLGGFTIAALTILLHIEEDKPILSAKKKILQLDPLGNLFFLPSIVCLLLALQWGGVKYAWSHWRVVVLFVFFSVCFLAWLAVQYFLRNGNATIPRRVILQRSVLFGGWFQFMLGACLYTTVLYIPLWFQAIKGTSPVKSGIDTIPMLLGVVIGSIMSGAVVSRVGYYTPFIYIGVVLMSIGSGLITTFQPDTNHSKWIGYQVIFGLGIGFGMQQSNMAVQTCLPDSDVPIGTSCIFFFQMMGSAVFSAVGQNIFIDKFLQGLTKIPGINPHRLVETGATALRAATPPGQLSAVLAAYNHALTQGPFLASTICACLAIFGAIGTEWRSVHEKKEQQMARRKKTIPRENDMEAEAGSDNEVDPTSSPQDTEKPVTPEVASTAVPNDLPATSKETAA